jgi:N-acyl-D-amino-acid deacylase
MMPSLSSLLPLLFCVVLTAHAADYDLLITHARIADGTGAPLREGRIGIKGQRIVALGEAAGTATQTLDAGGLVVAPGFIDVHTHSEDIPKMPLAENFLRMGVTTIITGNCGASDPDVAKFFRKVEASKCAINVATLIGHGTVRRECMGGSFIRAPSAEQLKKMQAMVEQAMKDGAVGMSTGLIYVPGSYAKTDEITALATVVAEHGGTYASHIRSENVKIITAIEEFLTIARDAKVRAELSHIKLSGPAAWGMNKDVLAALDEARSEGLTVTHDQYAYTASSTGLAQTIPDEALEGTSAEFAARLDDPEQKAKLMDRMKDILHKSKRTDYSHVVIANCKSDPELNGLRLPAAAKVRRGADTLEDQIELILTIQRQGGATAIYHGINEDDLKVFMQHPLTMVASDGGPKDIDSGVTHPRSFGNNARVLARYVRELKLLPLETAIQKMTSLPAQTFRLQGRGVIEVGAWADLVAFDPATVQDTSTFEDPVHMATGMVHVLVRGVPVIKDGTLTDARPGGPLRLNP